MDRDFLGADAPLLYRCLGCVPDKSLSIRNSKKTRVRVREQFKNGSLTFARMKLKFRSFNFQALTNGINTFTKNMRVIQRYMPIHKERPRDFCWIWRIYANAQPGLKFSGILLRFQVLSLISLHYSLLSEG